MPSFIVGSTMRESFIRCGKWFWAAVKRTSFDPFPTLRPGRPAEANQGLPSMRRKVSLWVVGRLRGVRLPQAIYGWPELRQDDTVPWQTELSVVMFVLHAASWTVKEYTCIRCVIRDKHWFSSYKFFLVLSFPNVSNNRELQNSKGHLRPDERGKNRSI